MKTREAKKIVLNQFKLDIGNLAHNATLFYAVANPIRNGEVRIDTYACRLEGRTRKPLCKCVQRCYSDRPTIAVRDIYRGYMGGFKVDFSDMTRQCRHYAEAAYKPEALADFPVGSWDAMQYEGFKTNFLVNALLLNDLNGTKYAHCGIERTFLHPMRFFECYHISHAVEFLAKNDLARFITPSFVRRLKNEKRVFDFFRMNFRKLRDCYAYGIREVRTALANNCSLEEAVERITAAKEFANCRYCPRENIPTGINRWELYKWCRKTGVSPHDYRRYAGYIENAGENLCAYGVTFPRDFAAALEEAERRSHLADERERRRRERLRREQDRIANMNAKEHRAWRKKENERIRAKIEAMARKLAKLNGITGYGYAVVVPKSAKMLLDEGNAMKNCIGRMGYDRKIADGQSLVFFLRGLDGKKNVDVEVRIVKSGKSVRLEVAQCYNPCNQNPPEEAKAFARELADMAREILYRKAA